MITCGGGTVQLSGSTSDLLVEYSAITHCMYGMLKKDMPENLAVKLLVETSNMSISEESNDFFKEVKNE